MPRKALRYQTNQKICRILTVLEDISQHWVNQSGYIMTVSSDEKDHLFNDYLMSLQFR